MPPTAPGGFPIENTPIGPTGPRGTGFRGRVQPVAPRARGAPAFRGRGRGSAFDAGNTSLISRFPLVLTVTTPQHLQLAHEPPLLFPPTCPRAPEISTGIRIEIRERRPRNRWIMGGTPLEMGRTDLYGTSLAEILNGAPRTMKAVNRVGSEGGHLLMIVEGQNGDDLII
jgi:hypothetical protein